MGGLDVGAALGATVLGAEVGLALGALDGTRVGSLDEGAAEGALLGATDGDRLSLAVGAADGALDPATPHRSKVPAIWLSSIASISAATAKQPATEKSFDRISMNGSPPNAANGLQLILGSTDPDTTARSPFPASSSPDVATHVLDDELVKANSPPAS